MKLTLLSQSEISSVTLPEKCMGRYPLRIRNENGKQTDIISVEALRAAGAGERDKWILKSNRRFSVIDKDKNPIGNVELGVSQLYRIQSADRTHSYTLFTEPLTDDRKQYKGYTVTRDRADISIGRDEKNAVCYSSAFVSSSHAVISFSANGIFIKDSGSTNGTYVNGRSVKEQRLFIGDVVYIMGMQIIITNRGLFLNDPDGKVSVQTSDLREFHAPAFRNNAGDEFEEIPTEFYYRAPRFKQDVEEYQLKVDAPPNDQNNDEMPMIMLIGPSMTMGMASVASGIFTVTSAIERGNITSAIPSLVMCVSMLLGTLMWPIITKLYQKRLRRRKEAKRRETYTAYLNQLEQLVAREMVHQEQILHNNDVNTEVCVGRILSAPPRIWERTPKHTDFLSLRLGYGNLPFKANIQYSERKFTVERDDLTEMMYEFGEKQRELKNVPICLPLTERFVSGIYGDKGFIYSYAKTLILQLVTLHSYDEMKIVLIYDESRAEDFSFARWLPHSMNNERTVRYIATNSEEAKGLSGALDPIIEYRKDLSPEALEDEKPYFVIICLDKELGSKTECVRRVSENKENIKFSVLSVCERLVDLPKECSAVTEISGGSGSLTLINDVSELPVPFKIDAPQSIDIQRVTDVLANTFVDISGSNFSLPKKYTFFEMLDIGMIEHLNIADNWSSNDPTRSLAATIGIDKYGEPFKLDLHERAHGPHGLIAGMTGSGKSEFIIAYILSMAVNFHPYEVAFILIDYKGGGMAKSFENIPHTAGVITNLDGNGIKRSLSSMRSELHRREKIFRDTSKKHNVSNIDIYKYQKLFREGKVSEPLPHLFIISDEFAELKKEQPDFMTELTSTARVGRSLGVHLILATQKPGGVVDDQIRSNSRFKICLKVQDSGDSREMLGRPEAAALVDTGRFYLQVGYNEIFEIGQSAWAGAPYYPSQKTIKDRDDAVSIINTNGRVIAEANTNPFEHFVDPPKQLDVITDHIAKYCEEAHIERWKMWLDPIEPLIYVDRLAEKYKGTECGRFELAPIIGEYDDPAHQRQDILRLPLTKEGNAIVYGSAGNGKAMFLESVCYSLMREHTPSEVNIYIMDFGAETFTAFVESPYIGDVILSHETEKVNNLFKLIAGKLDTRKKLLAEYGVNLAQYNEQAEKPEPNIVIMINNYAAFNELFEEKSNDMSFLTREGVKYGIYFILACTGTNNVRFSMLQNFKLLYCLQMNNADDYSSVVGKTDGLLPEKFKGRGIVRFDKDTLVEFQTASIVKEDPPYPAIRGYCAKLAEKYSGHKAQKVPVLPEKVTQEFLAPYAKPGDLSRVPVGVEKNSLEIAYFDFTSVVTPLLSENMEWMGLSEQLAAVISKECSVETIVISPVGEPSQEPEQVSFSVSAEECGQAVYDIYNTVCTRNNAYKTGLNGSGKTETYEPLVVIIRSISQLKKLLEKYEPSGDPAVIEDIATLGGSFEALQFIMSRCIKEYNVHFVVCENINELNNFVSEKWYETHFTGKDGLWIGSGISSQYRLAASRKPKEFDTDIESDLGFVIRHSSAVMVKFL